MAAIPITFNPFECHRIYEVTIQQPTATLSYKAEVEYWNSGDYLHCRISKSHFLVDGNEPGTTLDKLALLVANCLYPLILIIKKDGTFDVVNQEAVQKKWNETRQHILDNYTGDVVARYLEQTQEQVQNKVLLLQSVQKDYFIVLYLYGLRFSKISIQESLADEWMFPTFANPKPLPYAIKLAFPVMDKSEDEPLEVTLVSIKANTKKSQAANINLHDPNVLLTADYTMENSNGRINKLDATYKYGSQQTDITVRLIEKKEIERKPVKESELMEMEVTIVVPNKKSWLARLFE